MLFFVIFVVIDSALAYDYVDSLLDHYDGSIWLQRGCPPLRYGPYCNIPYCFPEYGRLKRSDNLYYCSCSSRPYVSGIHCEIIECQNEGRYSNSTSACICPEYTYGHFCQDTLLQYVGLILALLILVILISLTKDSPCRKRWTPSETNPNPSPIQDFLKLLRYIIERIQYYWRTIFAKCQHCWGIIKARIQYNRGRMSVNIRKVFIQKPKDASTTPAPEVRIVERIVHRDGNAHHDAPSTYLTSVYSELPTYETAGDSVESPKYTN